MQPLETKAGGDYVGLFLSQLFQTFEQEGLDYAVARDYESLPHTLNGRDLDILVKDSDIDRAFKVLVAIAESLSASVFKIVQEADTYAWAFITHCDSPSWGIHIDFLQPRCANWRGCSFLDETAAMERKVRAGGISTLRSDDIVFMQFCRDLVGRLSLREKYHAPVRHMVFTNPKKFETELRNIFGRRCATKLVEICRQEKFGHLATLGKRLRRALIIKALLREPAKATKDMIRYFSWRCREYLKPNGIMVAVLGPDGPNNKEALIEKVQDGIYKLTRSKPHLYHRRPRLLPSLGFSVRDKAEDRSAINAHRERALPILSTLRLAYYTVDYVLGYWLLVRPYLGRKSIAAIFDSYFYEYTSNPAWLRGSLQRWVVRFLSVFVPKPDVVIFLSADPKTTHGCESEPSMEEIHRETQETRRLASGVDSPVWIHTSRPIQHVAQDIIRAIIDTLGKRLGGPQTNGDKPADRRAKDDLPLEHNPKPGLPGA